MRNKGWAGQEVATTESSCVCLRFQFVPFQSTMMANLQPELYKHGKREPWIKNCLCHTELRLHLWGSFLMTGWCRRARPAVAATIPRQLGPSCVREAAEHKPLKWASQRCCSYGPILCSHCMPTITSLTAELWPRSVSQNFPQCWTMTRKCKPDELPPPHLAFGQGVYRDRKQTEKTLIYSEPQPKLLRAKARDLRVSFSIQTLTL